MKIVNEITWSVKREEHHGGERGTLVASHLVASSR
jgi:hypothetical protein